MNDFKFTLHVLFHPLDGFYDMKYEKKGKIQIALLGVFLYAFTNVFRQQVTSFLFNPLKQLNANFGFQMVQVLVLFSLFCIGNWSITSLFDGKGKISDIAMVFGYSCYAIVLIQIPIAVLSNIASFSEISFIQIPNLLSMIWFVALLFLGTMTIHQYSLVKMFAILIMTIVAMMVLAFIYLLFFYLISQILLFILAIYKEMSFRLL